MSTALPATLAFDDVEVGQSLPDLSVEIDTALIVATAVATRDFQDVHHDKDRARALGSPDVFVGRFVTDWAGPNAVVRSIAIRLGVPNYPGDTMRMTGSVTAKEVVEGEGIVEVEVRGANRLGDHVTGTVRLVLPRTGKATS